MTIQAIFDLGLEMGMAADPRRLAGVTKYLERKKKDFDELSAKKKKYFDKEDLINPYTDSRIMFGDPKTRVKTILAGIDMNTGEVLLADRLSQKGKKIDLVIAHHPEGHALAALHEVMDLQVDLMATLGIPVNVGEGLMRDRTSEVARRFHPVNHTQAIDAARLLNLPFLSMHTIWDNMGHQFVQEHLDKKKGLDAVSDVFDALMELPEYQEATRQKAGPFVAVGSEKSRAGKVVVGFTGGTEGPKEMFEAFEKAGVGTIVEMHLSEDHVKELKNHHMNAIITGHMASDSIGANLFFDEVEKKGIEIVPCSGLIRVKR